MEQTKRVENFFINISTNLFITLNGKGQVLFANDKAKYIFETIREAQLPPIVWQQIKPRVHNVFYQNFQESFQIEYRGRFYSTFAYPYEHNVVLCLTDITENRQLSHQLHKIGRRLEFAERTAHLGYWELDLENRRFYWSAEIYRIFGVNPNNISEKRNLIRELVFPEDFILYKREIGNLLRHKKPVEGQIRIKRADGRLVYCLFKAGLVSFFEYERIAGVFQDISALAEIQQRLEKAKQYADEMNLEKSRFLAKASHDLRQPMQALSLFISALKEEKLTSKQKAITENILQSSENLKLLLDNLLDISKLDSGGMEYIPESFNIKNLIEKILTEFQMLATSKNIRIKQKLENVVIYSDSLLLERIIRNLLSNALKYTMNTIKISCYKKNEYVYIQVMDNGIGISQEEKNRVFDAFYQNNHISGNRANGTGLGLSIVKKATELLNGKINIRSVAGKYTAFTLKLHI